MSDSNFFRKYADLVEGTTITESAKTFVTTLEFDHRDSPEVVMKQVAKLLKTVGLSVVPENTDADFYRFKILK